jgi:aspartyl-tRNA(Asn)/glutamyl-tRNA(Gln) amidotransferase subunit A
LEEDKILNAANIFEIDAQVIKNRPLSWNCINN